MIEICEDSDCEFEAFQSCYIDSLNSMVEALPRTNMIEKVSKATLEKIDELI